MARNEHSFISHPQNNTEVQLTSVYIVVHLCYDVLKGKSFESLQLHYVCMQVEDICWVLTQYYNYRVLVR